MNTLLKCHLSPGRGRRRRSRLAKVCPYLRHRWWDGLVGDDPTTREHHLLDFPQAQRKRKYSHTQWLMISTWYRCPLYNGNDVATQPRSTWQCQERASARAGHHRDRL
jgi:hypothetical protein